MPLLVAEGLVVFCVEILDQLQGRIRGDYVALLAGARLAFSEVHLLKVVLRHQGSELCIQMLQLDYVPTYPRSSVIAVLEGIVYLRCEMAILQQGIFPGLAEFLLCVLLQYFRRAVRRLAEVPAPPMAQKATERFSNYAERVAVLTVSFRELRIPSGRKVPKLHRSTPLLGVGGGTKDLFT